MTRLLLRVLLAVAISGSARAQAVAPSAILWQVSGTLDDFVVARDTAVAHTGRASIRFFAEEPPANFAGILTSMPAAPYEGRRLRVSAQLRGSKLAGELRVSIGSSRAAPAPDRALTSRGSA